MAARVGDRNAAPPRRFSVYCRVPKRNAPHREWYHNSRESPFFKGSAGSVPFRSMRAAPVTHVNPAAVKRHVCAALHRIRPASRVGVVDVEAPTVRQLRRLECLARREHKRRTRGKANYGPFHGIIQPHFSSRDTKTGLWSDVSRSVVTWDSLTETLPAWAVSTAI